MCKYDQDCYYLGEWKKGTKEKHGRGVYFAKECRVDGTDEEFQVYSDDIIYEGYWLNNKWHDKGRKIRGDEYFIGKFKEGKKHGPGFENMKKQTYEGEWQNDR